MVISVNASTNTFGAYTYQSMDEATPIEQSDSTFTFYQSAGNQNETGAPEGIAMWGVEAPYLHRVALVVPEVGIIESPISFRQN